MIPENDLSRCPICTGIHPGFRCPMIPITIERDAEIIQEQTERRTRQRKPALMKFQTEANE